MEKFADLHCHPHLRSFNWLRHSKYEKKENLKKKYFHPWFIVWSKPKAEEKGIRANAYSQIDLIKLVNGKVKLVFVSLYPMEKGWFKGKDDLSSSDLTGLLSVFSKLKIIQPFLKSPKLKEILLKIGQDEGRRTAFRDILQSLFMKFPRRRINFIQSNNYEYFEELKREKEFLGSRNNKHTESEINIPGIRKIFLSRKKLSEDDELHASGTYEIAKNGNNVKEIIDNEKSAFVLTIEGANVFNTDEDIEQIKKRILEVKNWKTFKHTTNGLILEDSPVFFISFAHHFNNYLCGHAHSIPDIGNLILDQKEGMNTGFNEKGKEIIRYFLSLDNENVKDEDKYGRRILIDIKHMSAAAREYYYNEIIHPCSRNGDKIPIIASHVAYSGEKTLDELINYANKESDNDAVSTIEKPFNTWNINLCDEDIKEIFESDGIIGLNFDQRILAVPKRKRKKEYPDNFDISYFWENLKAMMAVILKDDNPEQQKIKKVHGLFGLGTDFDGYIDPLDTYPTAIKFKLFEQSLMKEIEKDQQKDRFLFGANIVKFVEGICYQNAYDFVIRNFN